MDNWTIATKLRQGTYRQGIFYHDLSLEETEQHIARIRAEARAEARKGVADVAKNWLMKKWFVMNGVKFLIPASDIESFVSAILADEQKEERGAEAVGKLVAFSRRPDGVAVTILFSDKPDMDITTGQAYAMRRAEVERRIEEAGQ